MRPNSNEFAPFYAGYVNQVPDEDIFDFLKHQGESFVQYLYGIPAVQAAYAYAPGKWTLAEVVGHINDAERVFAYRAMRIARGETIDLPGFAENDYVANGKFGLRPYGSLIEEFRYQRMSNLHLYHSFDEEQLAILGKASGQPVSVRGLLYITAGHVQHHWNIIKERYQVEAHGHSL